MTFCNRSPISEVDFVYGGGGTHALVSEFPIRVTTHSTNYVLFQVVEAEACINARIYEEVKRNVERDFNSHVRLIYVKWEPFKSSLSL